MHNTYRGRSSHARKWYVLAREDGRLLNGLYQRQRAARKGKGALHDGTAPTYPPPTLPMVQEELQDGLMALVTNCFDRLPDAELREAHRHELVGAGKTDCARLLDRLLDRLVRVRLLGHQLSRRLEVGQLDRRVNRLLVRLLNRLLDRRHS